MAKNMTVEVQSKSTTVTTDNIVSVRITASTGAELDITDMGDHLRLRTDCGMMLKPATSHGVDLYPE